MNGITLFQLQNLRVWTNWDYVQRDNKPSTKVPRSKVNVPESWLLYTDAYHVAQSDNCGIGLMFAPAGMLPDDLAHYALCGIDIDAHNSDQNTDANVILNMFKATYAEVSPSGKGYHIILLVDIDHLPKDYKDHYYFKNSVKEVECYIAGLTNRYFTFTNNKVAGHGRVISDQTGVFLNFLRLYMMRTAEDDTPTHPLTDNITTITTGEKEAASSSPLVPSSPPSSLSAPSPAVSSSPALTPEEIQIRLNAMYHAKNGAKAKALFSGDTSGYGSQSEAVQALCNYLAFYFGQYGADAVKSVFDSSALAVGKWAERTDIIYATINKALASVHKYYTPRSSSPLSSAPSPSESEGGKKKLIQFADFLQYCSDRGYDMRFNDVSKSIDFLGFDARESAEHLADNIPAMLKDGLKVMYTGVSTQVISEYILLLATRRKYNPILDLITSTPWDGVNRIVQLFDILGLNGQTKDDLYSQIYIQKWLMQCVCVLYNDIRRPFAPDLVLVLQGRQGLGKTRLLEHLAMLPQYFGGGLCLDPRNKDSVMQVTNKWIVELGEIGSTMRKDIDLVKSYLTMSVDEYRAPYGRAFTRYPRRTSFAGTVNDYEYLIDETGNRRFLTIPLSDTLKIDYEKQIAPFDALQLWAQVWELVKDKDKSACFRLSDSEKEFLIKRNSQHEKMLKGESDVLDALAEQSGADNKLPNATYITKDMTVTEFIQHNDLRFDARQVTKILKKHGYISDKHRVNGVQGRYFKLPYRYFSGNK